MSLKDVEDHELSKAHSADSHSKVSQSAMFKSKVTPKVRNKDDTDRGVMELNRQAYYDQNIVSDNPPSLSK